MFRFKKCDGCNRDLPLGITKFNVRIEIASDFDGFLPENEGSEEGGIEALFEQIEMFSEDDLESEVHLEMNMTLCSECRDRFIEEMEGYSDGGLSQHPKLPINIH